MKTELRTISLFVSNRRTFIEAYAEVTKQYHAELSTILTDEPLQIALSHNSGYVSGEGYFASVLASVQFIPKEKNDPAVKP